MPTSKSVFTRRIALSTFCAAAISLATAGASFAASDSVRTIRIATAAESQPLSWGAIGVEPQGYEPELLKAINARLPQYKFEMEGAADIAQETGLATGKYDMVSGGYYWSEARDKQFLITTSPTGASMMKIYSRKGSGINTMKDLVGKRIVPVSAGGGVYRFSIKWMEKNPGFELAIKGSSAGIPYPDRLKEVNNSKFDALILPSNLGQSEVIGKLKLDVVSSDPVIINNTYFLIHRSEENQAFVEDVSRILKEMKADGTLDKLSLKWFGEEVIKHMK